jgi:hypothetical protein
VITRIDTAGGEAVRNLGGRCARRRAPSVVAPPECQPPLDRQLKLLDDAVQRAFTDDADVDAALVPDMQGIGSGPDVMSHPPSSASPPARDTPRPLAETAGARHD